MPGMPPAPTIDVHNPLYCPAVPAASYLNSLRNQFRTGRTTATVRRHSSRRSHARFDTNVAVSSFSRLLCKALLQDAKESPKNLRKTRSQTTGFQLEFALDEDVFAHPPLGASQSSSSSQLTSFDSHKSPRFLPPAPTLKRRPSLNQIIHRPAKQAKTMNISLDEPEEEIFLVPLDFGVRLGQDYSPPLPKVTVKKSASNEELLVDKIRTLEDSLYGPPIGPESPRGLKLLADKLDALLPGIRLKQRLSTLKTHQAFADYLAEYGLLNLEVVSILRTSEIRSLALSHSLEDEDGLNINGRDCITVFSKPNSFIFLTELSFSGTQIRDFDLTHIQRLPRLSTLQLDKTGIGNEAVYILTSLKRTLTHLTVAQNPDVNNDAIPALILLSKLAFLSILDTDIDMVGVRRLAQVINQEGRIIDVEIPNACELYLDNMNSKYLVTLNPPLIVRASLCGQLSAAALKRNLAAHSACNEEIVASGTKQEMKDRLESLLRIREMDLVVAAMFSGEGSSLHH